MMEVSNKIKGAKVQQSKRELEVKSIDLYPDYYVQVIESSDCNTGTCTDWWIHQPFCLVAKGNGLHHNPSIQNYYIYNVQ